MAKVPDVFFDTIGELSARLRAKEFSCVELTRAFCDRLERIGPRFNALALSLREQAIRQAKDVDSELKRGRTRGPLQGIPYGVKDLLAVKGHPTTWGAKPFAGQVFDQDAFVIDKLNKAGAILVGKLAMVELAGGGDYRFPSASLTGPGLNPWDRTRWSGGSSSGSATAEAAGLVTFALGSETSGSIITPSAFCGVTGLRPTYGLVSRRGAMALSWTLDKIGPICRSAEDCALVLHEISGSDIEDPGSAGKSFTYSPQFARKPKDITIGYAPVDFEAWAEPDARPGLQAALEVVKGLGVQMKEVELPDFPYGAITEMIVSARGRVDLRGSDPRREGRSARRPPPGSRAQGRAGGAGSGVSAGHARASAGAGRDTDAVPGRGCATRPVAPGRRAEDYRAPRRPRHRIAAGVTRHERDYSLRQSGWIAGHLAAVRFRGKPAGRDFAGGSPVLRESIDRGGQGLSEPDGLA